MSFIVPPNAIPGRLGLLLTLFLCMVNTLNSVSLKSPKSNSGPTALVIWIVTCICFQLLAILEYAWVIAAKLSDQQVLTLRSSTEKVKGTQSKYKTCTKNMDHIMISAFPTTFIVFAVLFWIWIWNTEESRFTWHWIEGNLDWLRVFNTFFSQNKYSKMSWNCWYV